MRSRLIRSLKYVVILACLAGLAAGAVVLVQTRKAARAEAPRYGQAPMLTHGVATRRGDLMITTPFLAVVEPVRTATLAARLTSQVDVVVVDEGDAARANEPLLRLDDREIVSAIAVAQTRITQAEAELAANEATVAALEKSADYWAREAERMQSLRSSEVVASSQAEAARDKADQTSGQLNAARLKSLALRQQTRALRGQVDELVVRKGYCVIASPFDGIVTRRLVDPGDQAAPGKPLLVVEDRSALNLAFDIPQREASRIQPGMEVRFSGPDGERVVEVSRLYPALNETRMARVEVALEGEGARGLITGAWLTVSVTEKTLTDVTLAPASALVESPQGRPYVFVVEDGVLQPVSVTILGHGGDEAAIAGVEPGVVVVTSTFLGWSRLSAGLSVEVRP